MKIGILFSLSTFLFLESSFGIMSIKIDSENRGYYTILENDKPVLTYNFGTVQVPKGVTGSFAIPRSDYVHPVFGPSGEILTGDFDNQGHNHHRGIYWAWAEVAYQGRIHDLHALGGVFARPVKILKKEVSTDKALISEESVWRWEEREDIVKEQMDITAYNLKDGLRRIDFDLTLTALKNGISIARRDKKSYASFNVRMSPRKDIKVVRHIDPASIFPQRAWGEVIGIPPGGKEPIGMMILQNPKNLFYPGVWTYFPYLPWLEPGFPIDNTTYTLQVGQPLKLSYRVIIRNGKGLAVSPESLFDEYVKDIPYQDPLIELSSYKFGQSRIQLTAIEKAIRDVGKSGYPAMEARLINILNTNKCSNDFEKWAFGQLQMIGSDACIQTVYKALCEHDSWQTALEVLIALPGEKSAKLLLEGLESLPEDRRAVVIHGFGLRGDVAAIPVLEKFAAEGNKDTARSARSALRKINKGTGYDSCGIEKICGVLSDEAIDRALQKADELGQSEQAKNIYTAVWESKVTKSWQKASALIGLSRISSDMADEVVAALSSPDKHIRNGAAKAMEKFERPMLKKLCKEYALLNDQAKIVILNAWMNKGVTEAEPQILISLKSKNPVIRLAAMRSLATTGRSTAATEAVLEIAVSTSGSTSIEARETLGRMEGSAVVECLRKTAFSADSKRANVAVKVLAERKDSGYLDDMMIIAKGKIVIPSRTALTVLRRAGKAKEAQALRAFLPDAPDELKESIAEALVGIAKRKVPGADIQTLLKDAENWTGESRNAMVRRLPEIGGNAALAFVLRDIDETAVRALIKWPDFGAVDPLCEIIASGKFSAVLNRSAVNRVIKLIKPLVPAKQKNILEKLLLRVKNTELREQISSAIFQLGRVNIARGMKVSASKPSSFNPNFAVDGETKLNAYWESATPGAWLCIDLQKCQAISGVKVITFFGDGRYYQYYVEISTDNKMWKRVADMSKNTQPATEEGFIHNFASVDARYVRVVMLKNSTNPGLHIVEIEVYPSK